MSAAGHLAVPGHSANHIRDVGPCHGTRPHSCLHCLPVGLRSHRFLFCRSREGNPPWAGIPKSTWVKCALLNVEPVDDGVDAPVLISRKIPLRPIRVDVTAHVGTCLAKFLMEKMIASCSLISSIAAGPLLRAKMLFTCVPPALPPVVAPFYTCAASRTCH